MRPFISIVLGTSILATACERAAPPEPADIVLRNGGVYTVDGDRSWAEAIAVRDGLIVAVGDGSAVDVYIGDGTRVIDLGKRLAMPGIHDSHIHPLEGGYEEVWCNLHGLENVDAVIGALSDCSSEGAEWFTAVGLDLALFGLRGPDKSILEGIAPGSYIFVDAADGHAALVNDKALELVGFSAASPDPVGGVIERREGSREPNGTIRETARDMVSALRPPRSIEVSTRVMRRTIKRMNSYGITSIIDLWAGEHEYQIYKALDDAGELTVRVVNGLIDEGVFEKHTGADFERVLAIRNDYASERIDNNSIKLLIDGVFEGETGSVLEPYASVDHLGVLNHRREDLYARVLRYYNMGLQLHFHTMGDGAVRAALDALAYARERGTNEHLQRRHSLSHLGLIDPTDMPRFASLNAAASFTPVWASTDEWTINLEIPTLGQQRVDRMYPIRSVREAGAVVVGGSDWNYGDLDPLLSIETGITRQVATGTFPVRGNTAEAVDLKTIIDAYTINGAWLTHRDHEVGSIEVGKRADIVVFDRNLFEIDPQEISDAVVDLTIFDGRVVYDRATAATEQQ